jgi:prolipoprotein diacylglyceryl transferase
MIWHGGLASHGAALGVFLAYLVWVKVHNVKFTEYVDLLVIGMPLTAVFVRIGNFFNSEIIGKPTDGSWGVIFKRLGEDFPRYPTQIYESLLSLLIFIILVLIFLKFYQKIPKLFLVSSYIFLYFASRFVVEFWKERHILAVDFPLSMGQILSILPIIVAIGIIIYIFAIKKRRKER